MTKSPYLTTTLIFAILLFVGRRYWHWGGVETAFLLLFFFLVTIGIRLDDIAKEISATNERLDRLLGKNNDSSCRPKDTPATNFRENDEDGNHEPVRHN